MAFSLESFSLAGQTALVTGAGRGIGQALSLALAQAGAKVIVSGRRADALAETAGQVEAAGGEAVVAELDVTEVSGIDNTLASLAQRHGLDILINNAGVEEVRPSVDVDEALWDRIVDTNLKGAFFCARAFARATPAGRPRSIVYLCSLTSAIGIRPPSPTGPRRPGWSV